jgi:hypothetical protein
MDEDDVLDDKLEENMVDGSIRCDSVRRWRDLLADAMQK